MKYPCKVLVEFLDDIYLVEVNKKEELYGSVQAKVNEGRWSDESYSSEEVEESMKVLGYFSIKSELLSWEN